VFVLNMRRKESCGKTTAYVITDKSESISFLNHIINHVNHIYHINHFNHFNHVITQFVNRITKRITPPLHYQWGNGK
jgi:hypothetical protein